MIDWMPASPPYASAPLPRSFPPTGLNLAQQEAVNYLHGPCLVLAGAGSGKTRVITHKIGAPDPGRHGTPSASLAITFTNKAAAEMRERAKGLIGQARPRHVVICTFHALGVRMMREDGAVLGLKARLQRSSIQRRRDQHPERRGGTTDAATARSWQWTISKWKNMGLNAAQAEARRPTTTRASGRPHHGALRGAPDGLPECGLRRPDRPAAQAATRRHERRARKMAGAYVGHVLVDEYQDTNATQYETAQGCWWAAQQPKDARFTAVGDDDQSIYGWRGATLDNLKKLPIDFPGAEGHQARAELPLHRRHPARRQQRDRPQPQAVPQEPVERPGRRRAGAHR